MGSKSSKFPFPSSNELTLKKIDNEYSDDFIDSMERADWRGVRKPAFHQRFEEFIVTVYDKFFKSQIGRAHV